MKTVRMPRADYIKEHKRLIRTLRSGNKHKIKLEYLLQSKELNSYLRKRK